MTKILFIDNGIEFDSKTLREKPYGGAEVAFVSLVEITRYFQRILMYWLLIEEISI